MELLSYNRICQFIEESEEKIGRIQFALLVTLILMILTAIYVRPAIDTVALGNFYAELANDPFSENGNAVGFRVLTPLLSYALGLKGKLIIVTNLILAFAFLLIIFIYFRKELSNPTDALLGTSVFALSLVTLTTIYYGGYCDSATYLIVLGMWILRSRLVLFFALLLLGLLNRESIVFLLPWFVFLGISESENKIGIALKLAAGFAIVFGIFYLFRIWVLSFRDVAFGAAYYFRPLLDDPLFYFKKSYGFQGLGFFTLFKALWIFVFVAILSFWKNRMTNKVTEVLLVIIFVWSQMFIAYDSSRMLTLAFPVMLISLVHLFKTNPYNFRSWGYLVLLFNLFVPQLYTAATTIEHMRSTIYKLIIPLLTNETGW